MRIEVKFFEVRDAMTFIPVMAVRGHTEPGPEHYLLRRAGWGVGQEFCYLTTLTNNRTQHDPNDWCGRTLMEAHLHIRNHWRTLENEEVIDVQFILGETTEKKRSECFEEPEVSR